jgi:hypothetical protein
MRKLLLKSLFARPVTIRDPGADDGALEELGRRLAERGLVGYTAVETLGR